MNTSFNNPTYNLNHLKQALNNVNKLRMTRVARQGAVELGMDDDDVVNVIQAIKSTDFYKTMPSEKMPQLANFDVYRTWWEGVEIYLKFQDISGYLVVSFKRR